MSKMHSNQEPFILKQFNTVYRLSVLGGPVPQYKTEFLENI